MASASLIRDHKSAAIDCHVRSSGREETLSDGHHLAIQPYEISTRILGMPDKTRAERLDWLRYVISSNDHRPLQGDIELSLTQSERQVDCLLLHGRDIRRMKQLVRRIHQLMPWKMLVCLLDDVSSKDIAELLFSGADIVFSLGMDAVEARARLRSAYRRYSGLFEDWAVPNVSEATMTNRHVSNMIEHGILFKSLRRRDRLIAKLLIARMNQLVTYDQLANLITSVTSPNLTGCREVQNALKISVSRIRAILPSNLSISNKFGRGYMLCFN